MPLSVLRTRPLYISVPSGIFYNTSVLVYHHQLCIHHVDHYNYLGITPRYNHLLCDFHHMHILSHYHKYHGRYIATNTTPVELRLRIVPPQSFCSQLSPVKPFLHTHARNLRHKHLVFYQNYRHLCKFVRYNPFLCNLLYKRIYLW